MKTKILPLVFLTAIFLSLAIVSAIDTDISFTPDILVLSGEQGSTVEVTFDVNNAHAGDLTEITITPSDLIKDVFTIDDTNLEIVEDLTLIKIEGDSSDTITLQIQIPESQETGVYTGTLTLGGTISSYIEDRGILDIELTVTEATPENEYFCNDGEGAIGEEDLKISKVKITNKGLSEDSEDNKWYPLDIIEVEVELQNRGDVEIEDMIFELGLFEEGSSTNIAEDMLWISEDDEEIEVGDIEEKGEDDELTHTFEFRVNPEDLEEGDYVLKIKTYSDDLGEDEVCIDYSDDLDDSDFGSSEYYAEISIEKEQQNDERAVVVDVEDLTSLEASCDQEFSLIADVWNIGEDDEDQVKVTLYNSELGIDMEQIIRGGLDEGDDKEELEFAFKIPEDAEEKTYTLEFQTYYDYDDDDDTFDEISKKFNAFLTVDGNCNVELVEPRITAELSTETPEAMAGEEVMIIATIRNMGEEETIYLLSVLGNSDWSSLSSIEPREVTLMPGESEDVEIVLDIDEDAEGDNEFRIMAVYGQKSTEQKIALFVEGTGTPGVTGSAIGDHLRANWFIYVIAVINIILIIAIIAVIKSMSTAKPAARA